MAPVPRPRSLSSLRRRGAGGDTLGEHEGSSEGLEPVLEGFADLSFDDLFRSFERLELIDGLKDIIEKERLRFKEAVEKHREITRARTEELRRRFERRKEAFQTRIRQPEFVAWKDKVAFILGLGALLATQFILLKFPKWMWLWYSFLIVPLLFARYVVYRAAKYQYFCYDFCYVEQVSLCLALFSPLARNITFHRLNFAVSNGPLAFAVAIWGNSLVFHSLDKMTSLFIHILPPVVTYCLRWYGAEGLSHLPEGAPSAPVNDDASSDLVMGFFTAPLLLYIAWQCLYLFKTEVISKKKLERDEELMTSKRWLTRNQKGVFYTLINAFGPQWQTQTFVLLQLIYTVLTLLPAVLWYKSQIANTAFLLLMLSCSMWNGANYYFDIFASRYMDELQKLRKSFEQQISDDVSQQSLVTENHADGTELEHADARGTPKGAPKDG